MNVCACSLKARGQMGVSILAQTHSLKLGLSGWVRQSGQQPPKASPISTSLVLGFQVRAAGPSFLHGFWASDSDG